MRSVKHKESNQITSLLSSGVRIKVELDKKQSNRFRCRRRASHGVGNEFGMWKWITTLRISWASGWGAYEKGLTLEFGDRENEEQALGMESKIDFVWRKTDFGKVGTR